jgi:hypothetical protein
MALLDLNNEALSFPCINNAILAATTQSPTNGLDWENGEYSLNMVVAAQVPTAANVTNLVLQAEESDNATTTGPWSIVSGVASAQYGITQMILTVTATTAPANLYQQIMGLRTKRYVRINASALAATTTTGAFPVTALLFSQKKLWPTGVTGAGGVSRSPSA